jgi:hypothetical protein
MESVWALCKELYCGRNQVLGIMQVYNTSEHAVGIRSHWQVQN